ncbi:MAG: hypothetical protein ACYS67_09575, partial [Planctomycetota bacterium]
MDEIQRKLALIDRQLAWSWANVHKQIISTTPLLFTAVGLILGIVIQNILHLPIWFWLIASGICVAAAIISYRVKVENLTFISAYMALLCFLCLG